VYKAHDINSPNCGEDPNAVLYRNGSPFVENLDQDLHGAPICIHLLDPQGTQLSDSMYSTLINEYDLDLQEYYKAAYACDNGEFDPGELQNSRTIGGRC
jgi:hypothetical protein